MRTDGQMDIATLGTLRDYKNAPKNWATSKHEASWETAKKIPSERSVCDGGVWGRRQSCWKHTEWFEGTFGWTGGGGGLLWTGVWFLMKTTSKETTRRCNSVTKTGCLKLVSSLSSHTSWLQIHYKASRTTNAWPVPNNATGACGGSSVHRTVRTRFVARTIQQETRRCAMGLWHLTAFRFFNAKNRGRSQGLKHSSKPWHNLKFWTNRSKEKRSGGIGTDCYY